MSTKFTYALILTVCGALFNLVMYFTGLQTEKLAIGQYVNWLGMVMMFVILWLGIKAVRDEAPEKGMSYGRGVGAGTLISLYSGLMSAVYNFIHFTWVNPEFADYQIAMARPKWEAMGMAGAQLDQTEKVTRMFMSPTATAIMTPIISVIFGLLCSLIIAAILKRPATGDTPPKVA